jgi:hypothetical protein
MKKLILFLAVGSFAITTFSSCKKKGCMDSSATNYNSKAKKDDGSCLYKPFVTIIGANDTTINVGTTYSDPGATATNKDGSSVTVTSTGQVNAATVGDYEITYSATNENGTTTAKRTVHVVVGLDNWVANWDVSSTCGAAFPLNDAPTISISGADALTIDGMFSISIPLLNINIASGGTANATINGSSITIPSQSYTVAGGIGTITYEGTGTMNNKGDEFVIIYNYTNTLPAIGGSGQCTATYTKQ